MENTREKLSPFVVASATLHALLVLLVMFGPALFPSQEPVLWGNSADPNVRVGVTDSLPGIPLPSPRRAEETAKGYTSKSLNPPEPAPATKSEAKPTPDESAVEVATKSAKREKKPDPAPPRVARNETPPEPTSAPSNAVPGTGGQLALPFGQSGAGSGQATFGDQTFGSRFPDYVTRMTNALRATWSSPGVNKVQRVYVTFKIDRGGQVNNLEIAQSAGSTQLDNAAIRAVRAATLPALPREYAGSSVDVRFYFESTR